MESKTPPPSSLFHVLRVPAGWVEAALWRISYLASEAADRLNQWGTEA